MESKVDHYNLYKLRKLNEGLWENFLQVCSVMVKETYHQKELVG
jgi:hypothetical protein